MKTLLAAALLAAPLAPALALLSGGQRNAVAGTCLIVGPTTVCAGGQIQYSSSISGLSYGWQFEPPPSNGASFCSATNGPSVCVATGAPNAYYRLKLTVNTGGSTAVCVLEVLVEPPVATTPLAPQSVCLGQSAMFTTTPLSGTPPFTFQWYHDGAAIAGANANSYTINLVATGDLGQYCVEVAGSLSGSCNVATECADLLLNSGCGGSRFCTLTQGAYGSAGGIYHSLGTYDLLVHLLATDLTVGLPGRSLTFPAGGGSAQCVIDRLPAGGPAEALPDFGDAVLSSATCQTSPIALPLQNGRFRNILLGQTLTLALNTRLDSQLSGFTLCNVIVTEGHVESGTEDGVGQQTFFIPSSVMNALLALGLPQTVGGLLELANRGLANLDTAGASLTDITAAADAINNAWDECGKLISCSNN